MSHKRETPRVGVLVRFEPADLKRIDLARGGVTRQDWISGAALGISRSITTPAKIERLKALEADIKVRYPDISLGAPKAKPGERLKRR